MQLEHYQTKISLHPELQEDVFIRRRMIFPRVPNDHILFSLSPLSKSGTIKFSFCLLLEHLISQKTTTLCQSGNWLANFRNTWNRYLIVIYSFKNSSTFKNWKGKGGIFLCLTSVGAENKVSRNSLDSTSSVQLRISRSNMTLAETWGVIFTLLVYCLGKWNRLNFQGKRTVSSNSWFVTAIINLTKCLQALPHFKSALGH